MSKHNVFSLQDRATVSVPLTELLQSGAKQLILCAVESEFQLFMEIHSQKQTESGHAAVVRNGYQPAREIQTGIGPVTVQIPKVRSRTDEPVTFRSALVPPYVRKTKPLEPLELAVTYTDERARIVSESTVYRLLKAHDLITSPAYILMQASDAFRHPNTRGNEIGVTRCGATVVAMR